MPSLISKRLRVNAALVFALGCLACRNMQAATDSENPAMQQRLAELAPLAEVEFADIKASIALRQDKGWLAASEALAAQSGKRSMDRCW